MRILFTGGGSGGHFYPILAIIRELRTIAEKEKILDLNLFYMGPKLSDEEHRLLEHEETASIRVAAGKMRRYLSPEMVLDIIKFFIGIIQGVWKIFVIMPDVVFSKGGFGAFPAIFAAYIFRLPLIIHESDAVPGLVNVFSRRLAKRVAISFPGAEEYFPKEKTALTGIPIRKTIMGGDQKIAQVHFGISSRLPVIGFIGASQGAQPLNQAVMGALKELTDEFEVIHVAGAMHLEEVEEESRVILEFSHKEHYRMFGFLEAEELRQFYAACDLIVSRAGASSIYELAQWGKPTILLPLDHAAQDHQRKNAYEYAASGAALVVEESNLTPHILLAEIRKTVENAELLKNMGLAAQKFARVDAASVLAHEILQLGIH